MKFKKLLIALLCALCAMCVCVSFAACGGNDDGGSTDNENGTTTNDADANLAEGTYVFYVYLDDGTTPVEDIVLQICNGDVCFLPVSTDANGRAEIEIDLTTYTLGENFCVHFYTEADELPDGYTYPSGGQTILTYENAWYITEQVTTFKLVKTA